MCVCVWVNMPLVDYRRTGILTPVILVVMYDRRRLKNLGDKMDGDLFVDLAAESD